MGSTFTLYLPEAYTTLNTVKSFLLENSLGAEQQILVPESRLPNLAKFLPEVRATFQNQPQNQPEETFNNDEKNRQTLLQNKKSGKKLRHRLRENMGQMLKDKSLLMVDDDPRNIFAVKSALEEHGIKVQAAENGKEAIQILNTTSTIDAILMDIMMPEMDGYETMKEIRKYPRFKNLPIIALTAKAMKGKEKIDCSRCHELYRKTD